MQDSMARVLRATSAPSASVVVPLLVELYKPTSVLDVGCGLGDWLAAFNEHGVTDLEGIDAYPPTAQAIVGRYRQHDLINGFETTRPYDLVLCLEVAEHLPSSAGAPLVAALATAAPVVVFSAAIPGQDGEGHVNLRWPDYWRELFAAHGLNQHDPIRARIWEDDRVAWWYRQNLFVYSHEPTEPRAMPERVVHPAHFASRLTETDPGAHPLREVIRALSPAARRALAHRIRRLRSIVRRRPPAE